jgi:voltage-gated potassium channel
VEQPPETMPARGSSYQLFMLALCIFALGTFTIDRLVRLEPDVSALVQYADTAVCMVFLVDFLYNLATAKNRWQYFITWGWIDLLSSIPNIEALRVGRLARVLRIFRILRGIKAARIVASAVLEKRAQSTFLAASLVTFVLLLLSSVAVLNFEDTPEANIKGPEDALWWSFVTITTVGYGDRFPVTSEGRIVGALVMVAGVGLFGVFSGFLASWFLAPRAAANRDEIAQNRSEIELLRAEITALRTAIERGYGPVPPPESR